MKSVVAVVEVILKLTTRPIMYRTNAVTANLMIQSTQPLVHTL